MLTSARRILSNLRPQARFSAFREERDTFGPIMVPADRLWGAQTQRSLENFKIGGEGDKMPFELIQAFAIIKRAMAKVNLQFGLDREVSHAI